MMRRALARPARFALGHPYATRTALVAAAARGRGLVLLFHRVTENPEPSTVLVPTIPRSVLREQIELLLRIGTVVPLASFLDHRPIGRTPRFALTFDDDLLSHHSVVLPLLVELGVTATFFLCGRALHGLAPPWFETLDALIRKQGPGAAALKLGLSASDVDEIAWACENDRRLQLIVEQGHDAPLGSGLGPGEIADLRDAGMTVGFHTLHHRVLPGLSDAEVDDALHEGREALEAVVAAPLRMFAYPHGKADARVARRVRLAGYAGAWTGRPRPIAPADDPHLLGRWEPGPVVGRDYGARIAARTNGWSGR
jgi:peptidoglycan/xylan/chitin deacetylase (PgdA/CDA1 family)